MNGKYSGFLFNKLSASTFIKLYTLHFIIKNQRACYGKEVLIRLKSLESSWQPSYGTLYPILKKMLEEGLIEIEYATEKRKYYAITDWGRSYYKSRYDEFRVMLVSSAEFYKMLAEEITII